MNNIYGSHDTSTIEQFLEIEKYAKRSALMADGHLGYVMPIGGVAAYQNSVSIVGVGFDIACGNMAIRLDCKINEIDIDYVLDEIEKVIFFGVGKVNPNSPTDHKVFNSDLWEVYEQSKREELKQLARNQLGTVGSGNHYVDIFIDEENYVWVGVHFGSRGLGHKTANGFMALAQNGDWESKPKQIQTMVDLDTDIGERYYKAMTLCGEYAYAGREWVCQTVQDIIGAARTYEVHNHHNYAWKENHYGEELIVVRKGATPAFPGQEGFIGGSMGDNAVIIEGVDSEKSKKALYSTVHGAGRVMSRSEARGKKKWVKNESGVKVPQIISDGKVTRDMMDNWIKNKGVKLRGGGTDESPQAYRRLDEVLAFHNETIKIKYTLKPVGVVMCNE
jgi:tRNA-splicing ligase RtcB